MDEYVMKQSFLSKEAVSYLQGVGDTVGRVGVLLGRLLGIFVGRVLGKSVGAVVGTRLGAGVGS